MESKYSINDLSSDAKYTGIDSVIDSVIDYSV